MTPQEQQLITELLARLMQAPAQTKDAVADQLIRRGVTDDDDPEQGDTFDDGDTILS